MKKTTGTKVKIELGEVSGTNETDKKGALKKLLAEKVCQIFEREPALAFNANFDKLVDDIISLF